MEYAAAVEEVAVAMIVLARNVLGRARPMYGRSVLDAVAMVVFLRAVRRHALFVMVMGVNHVIGVEAKD